MMVRATKKVDFYVSREVFEWLKENVPSGCLSCWAEDAFVRKIGLENLKDYNIKNVES